MTALKPVLFHAGEPRGSAHTLEESVTTFRIFGLRSSLQPPKQSSGSLTGPASSLCVEVPNPEVGTEPASSLVSRFFFYILALRN